MPVYQWFVFDIGNVVIKLDYEQMLAAIVEESSTNRDGLIMVFERMGGARDLERGVITFGEFHEFLREKVQYRGTVDRLREVWNWVLDGPVNGIEDVIARVRERYRVAFLSNTNEVHVEEIMRRFGPLFEEDDRFVFSHRYGFVKPDPAIYQLALKVLGALPNQLIFVDDQPENVFAAKDQGILTFRFTSSLALVKDLENEGLLARNEGLQSLLYD